MKIKYIFLVSLFCFFTNAQTEKGNFVISGSVGLNYTNLKTTADNMNDNNVKSFSIGPSVSYFVVDNLYLGLIVVMAQTHNPQIIILQ